MAKNSITDFDNTAANNTDIQSVNIDENCPASGINNAIRELMADLADVNDGTVALTSPKFDSIKDGNITPPDASGTDVAGTATTIKGGAGTGTGAGGSIIFQTADGGSTGSSVNSHATAMTITDDGSIDINGNDLILDADADTKLYASTDDVVKMNIAGSEMFRFDSDGIKFNGDTASANALYDYEFGTWTPAVSAGSITNAYGHYIKVGGKVWVGFSLSGVSDITSTTQLQINNLPFTPTANANNASAGAVFSRYLSPSPNATYIATNLYFYSNGGTGQYVAAKHQHFNSSSAAVFGEATYYTTS